MKQDGAVTLADVAQAAGVSVTTVSRVLNDSAAEGIRISERTQSEVVEAAERLGYRRNAVAAALRAKRSGLIAAVNRSMSGSFMSALAHHLELAVEDAGMQLFVARTRLDEAGGRSQLHTLQEQLFDGFLLLGDHDGYSTIAERISELGTPVVAVASRSMEPLWPAVNTNSEVEMALVVDHLLDLGHRSIAFVGVRRNLSVASRLNGFLAAMASRNETPHGVYELGELAYAPEDPGYFRRLHDASVEFGLDISGWDQRPTALVCGADGFAVGVAKGLMRGGLRVPSDVSVTGADDSREAFFFEPELTTVRQPLEEIAKATVSLLRRRMAGEDVDSVNVEPQLVTRASTGAPPREQEGRQ